MPYPIRPFRRLAHALPALAILGALSLPACPAGGWDTKPAIQLSCPGTAASGDTTRVSVSFSLPADYRLLRNPAVRVIQGTTTVELLPVHYLSKAADGRGDRALNTRRYPSGLYQVRAELYYLDPQGQKGTASSALVSLTVPKR